MEEEPILTALLIVARTAQIAASILITGIFTFEFAVLQPAGPPQSSDFHELELRLFRLTVWSLVVALLSGLLWFWLEVASMSGSSLANALSITAWRTVLFETEFGRVWQLRLGVLAVAIALVALRVARDELARTLILVLWLLGLVSLLSLAWVSHAAAATAHPLGLLGDMLHLCAAGMWLGGLLPLALFLARVRASFSLGETIVRVLQRFSTLSLCCVSVLVVSGISNSWLLVGSIHALFTTSYGRLLLFKLTLFAILVAFAARNRFIVKAKLLEAAAGPGLLPQLRRNVLCEVCLGVAVVVIVACLGVTPPARHP